MGAGLAGCFADYDHAVAVGGVWAVKGQFHLLTLLRQFLLLTGHVRGDVVLQHFVLGQPRRSHVHPVAPFVAVDEAAIRPGQKHRAHRLRVIVQQAPIV